MDIRHIINNAETVVFLVTGGNKAEKFTEIKNQTGNYQNYPASHVKPTSGRLLWFLDEAAVGTTSAQA